jgi:hypothetical protein
MDFEIFIYILRWVTNLIGNIFYSPPAHPSSYFMTSPLRPVYTGDFCCDFSCDFLLLEDVKK